jgi:hypothetical protein
MSGRVRLARLTDLAALGELSRLSQQEHVDARSLGLPVSGPRIGVFSLFRLPLGALAPNDLLFVYEDERRLSGLIRVERDTNRDEWTIVELDAIGSGDSGDIRYRLACSERQGNPELFMQAGFARYGQERLMFRSNKEPLPASWSDERVKEAGIRPFAPLDALALARLYTTVTPAPIARLEAYRLSDWERQGSGSRVPRSSLSPILRFAELESYVQSAGDGDAGQPVGLLQLGVAREEQPHYMRVLVRPDADAAALVEFGLGLLAARIGRGGSCPDNGVLSPVRTYESPVDRRLEEAAFVGLDTVTLLMKEAVVRVAEPALVPAVR